ncbi:restriction modification system DNA specificity domain protein [Halorhabdus utahensis DSM 12940]|uniref:Restriction modification system DNA specificity domain protein n=1 Tax=Halorhabdus utahensis (strain DSM 12940 / JCM 11049 / AX-2) TaxID=519442 RepID=C7NP00_HALUD|nr:restriction endonuclease subunit S [Halorhabdus utahensis]ACV10291.1 restriction modification system DNA specificity domain protein [Halorhabdus utahensis DSM 12940]
MSEEATLDEFVDEQEAGGNHSGDVSVGDLQQFESSPIESWNLVRLGEILTLEYGDNLPSDSRESGTVPVFGSNGQVDTHSEAAVEKPGIILGRKGSIGEIDFSDRPFWPIDTTYYITSEETSQNLRFLYYLLQNIQLERLNAASAIPGLNRNDAYGLKALMPPAEEQRKIASVLYTVDQAIQKSEEIIEQTERVRRGTEQDVLSRGVREDGTLRPDDDVAYRSSWVGDIPCDWDVKQYSKLISDSSVGIVVKPSQYYDDDGTVPILRSKDISRDGIVDGDFEYMSEESNAENENSRLQEGDVITVRSGDPGLSCVVDGEFDGANCADLLISTPGPKLDPHYAAMWINSFAGRKQIDRFQAGLAQKHFNLGALRKLRVGVPSLDEQKRIVEKVSSISESLESQRESKRQLQRLKQGLMQDLLSGKVRTHDTDIEIVDDALQHG